MVGKMKRIFCLLCLLTCVGASHAATMCVPDLSACESCTDATYKGITWTATCCGVEVSGIAVGMHAEYEQVVKRSVALTDDSFIPGNWYCLCVMTSPVLAPYAVAANNYCAESSANTYCAYRCSWSFSPRCAFAECATEYYCID